MIGSTRNVRVWVHRTACDQRKSYDTLAALVRHQLGADILSGDLYLFVGKDRKRCKVLYFDGTGLCLFQKRLSRGCFAAPWDKEGRAEMTQSELALFLEGASFLGRQVLSPPALQRKDMLVPPGAFS